MDSRMKTILAILLWVSMMSAVYAQLGANLLENPGAESGFDNWSTPNSDWGLGTAHTGSNGWAAGPITCTMYQIVDLIAKGYTADVLDISPSIATGIYVYPGGASGSSKGTISIKIELLNGSSVVIATTYISNNETLPLSMTDWTYKSTTISGYSSGMRKIKFTFVGLDALGWSGHYGPVFDDANIQINGPMPVELSAFSATVSSSSVTLIWKTSTEVDNYGFDIEKKMMKDHKGRMKDELGIMKWEKIGFVEGNGNSNAPKEYSYSDKMDKPGTYLYRLKQIDRDGKFSYSQEVEVTINNVPAIFVLEQNYPNPFNPTTTIGFTLQKSGQTTLKVYDAIGREVAVLVNESLEAGVYHQTRFDARQFAGGLYFIRLTAADRSQIRKMALLK